MKKIKITSSGNYYCRIGQHFSHVYCPFSGKICNICCPHFKINYNALVKDGPNYIHEIIINCTPTKATVRQFENEEASLPKTLKLNRSQINKYLDEFLEWYRKNEDYKKMPLTEKTWPRGSNTNGYFWIIFKKIEESIGNEFPIDSKLISDCIFNYKIKKTK